MTGETIKPLLIKRYASRRLYNTETSDYVTLEDIAGFIRDGREVKIIDLKSGDDLTRQYLLQIIAEHESRGENVLPVSVLTDLVRSYTTQSISAVPEFLAASFEMIREGQSKIFENMASMSNVPGMPGFDAFRKSQEAMLRAMSGEHHEHDAMREKKSETEKGGESAEKNAGEGLDEIKRQLSELQSKLNDLDK